MKIAPGYFSSRPTYAVSVESNPVKPLNCVPMARSLEADPIVPPQRVTEPLRNKTTPEVTSHGNLLTGCIGAVNIETRSASLTRWLFCDQAGTPWIRSNSWMRAS